jgi:hypothetical protein
MADLPSWLPSDPILDEDTEQFWQAHRARTGCQRPRSLAWVCVQHQAPIPVLPYIDGTVLTAQAPASFDRVATQCSNDKHAHSRADARLCIARRWKRHLNDAVGVLDSMLGIQGCRP